MRFSSTLSSDYPTFRNSYFCIQLASTILRNMWSLIGLEVNFDDLLTYKSINRSSRLYYRYFSALARKDDETI